MSMKAQASGAIVTGTVIVADMEASASGVAGRYLVKNPAEIPAADLADLAGREALAQHLGDGCFEESAGQTGPGGVGGLTGPGGQDVGIAADADVVDADGVSSVR